MRTNNFRITRTTSRITLKQFLALMQGNEDFKAEDFKVAMEQVMKGDIQLRCDVYGVMAEYMTREDI